MTRLQTSRLIALFFGTGLLLAGLTLYSVGINNVDAYLLSGVFVFMVAAVSYARNKPDKKEGKTIFQNLAEV
ncbi:MAG: hypothetical protein MUP66_02500 [Candidatus Nanohaloarchaeota archaeon QJJ-5]|nr:hypothetical protein [Candidatus Nanohaloarchaeota archaeon QJJ-5]